MIWEVYGPEKTHFLNYVRSIAALNDGGRWTFEESGTPFPFEETGLYRARRIKDRFTLDMLKHHLAALGLRPFEEDFYLPDDHPAQLIELDGWRPPGLKEFSLAEARARY